MRLESWAVPEPANCPRSRRSSTFGTAPRIPTILDDPRGPGGLDHRRSGPRGLAAALPGQGQRDAVGMLAVPGRGQSVAPQNVDDLVADRERGRLVLVDGAVGQVEPLAA